MMNPEVRIVVTTMPADISKGTTQYSTERFNDPYEAALHLLHQATEGQLRELRSGKLGQMIRAKTLQPK